MRLKRKVAGETSSLMMAGMIDIVFLLLIFFLLTFRFVEAEGDFNVHMARPGDGPVTALPLKLQLRADKQGELSSITLGGVDLGADYHELTGMVVSLAEAGALGDEPELEIETDYHLRYSCVIESISAVSGYKDGDQVVTLIDKIKFSKPRRQ